MDEALRQLLNAVPERAPRSKLEPHAEVIRELRRKRRTYQEIAVFLREHVQLSVAPSTIHEFVKTRARWARNGVTAGPELPPPLPQNQSASEGATAGIHPPVSPSQDPRRERMRAVKAQPVRRETEPPRFQFDPEEPLLLPPRSKEK